jgi:hypothetical protein
VPVGRSLCRCVERAPEARLVHLPLGAAFAIVLAGGLVACGHAGPPSAAALQPRGATVAFESIDGPPPAQFETLVRNLNDEAQARRLAVISRENPSAYRLRGYLAAKVVKGHTTISWVWDVFDRDRHRALRIEGEEASSGIAKSARDAWRVADDAMLHRIARASMDRLAAFLTSPGVAPAPAGDAAEIAYADAPAGQAIGRGDSSPEAFGIFRVFQAQADPALQADPDVPDGTAMAPDGLAGPVPLPPRRPGARTALSAGDTVTLAAASR